MISFAWCWVSKWSIFTLIAVAVVVILIFQLQPISSLSQKKVKSHKPFSIPGNLTLTGTELWNEIASDQGLQFPLTSKKSTTVLDSKSDIENNACCRDFFTVWPGDCVKASSYLDERIRVLSLQMVAMNSTMHFYTTDTTGCNFERYPAIQVHLFNATEELVKHGFASALPIIDSWDKEKFTRISDILRLCLAHSHQMSYLDTDVHFLLLQKSWFERAYVGAQMWSDYKNAIEITNAAFCLPRKILEDMMSFQRRKILKGGKGYKYFYTELGPSMFHHVSLYNAFVHSVFYHTFLHTVILNNNVVLYVIYT